MALVKKDHLKARALKMLESRIMEGKTQAEIAKDFKVSPATVERAMSLAAKGDLLISFEDKLHNELLPLAHQALVDALIDDNLNVKAKVALELFKGANLIKRAPLATKAEQQDADDLSAYIFAKRTHALLEETSIDVTPALTHAQPSATPGPDAPGDSEPDAS
jgi:predicted nuclease of restriction endonuclease-like RecB superfamily